MKDRIQFIFLCVGHLYDHLFMLIFATAAALSLTQEWGMSYSALIPYATPGFIAFGLCAIPAGWIADKWSRKGMMAMFFIGIGLSSILTSFSKTPFQIGVALFFIGVFASFYHPVGLALVVHGREKTGVRLAVNGIFGNMGVACAALLTGFFIDHASWRSAFILPGIVSILTGIIYVVLLYVFKSVDTEDASGVVETRKTADTLSIDKNLLIRVFIIIFCSAAIGGLVFQSTTFALPKVFSERLAGLGVSATLVGWYAFIVFALAAFGQLVVGFLVDRFSIRLVFALVAGLQSVFFAVMTGLTGWSALIIAIIFMLVVFGQIPINDVLIGRITKSEWRSRVYAFRYIVTFSVMASSVPLIAGIHAKWGFDTLFAILSGATALVFVIVLMLPKSISGKRSD